MPGGLMSRLRFLNVKNILPAMIAVMLLILMACGGDGDADTTTTSTSSSSSSAAPKATSAPAAAAKPAAKSNPTPVPPKPAATAVPKTGPKAGGHIRMSAYADTKDWDPKGSSSLSSIMSYSQLYNQIVQMDTVDVSKVVCDLCESWAVSNGGETVTFKLHQGVKWGDGEDLNVDDVIYSLRRYMDPETKTARSGLFRNYTLPMDEGLRAIDDHTFEMNLLFPSGAFLKFLAVDYVKVLPEHLLSAGVDLNRQRTSSNTAPPQARSSLMNTRGGTSTKFPRTRITSKKGDLISIR